MTRSAGHIATAVAALAAIGSPASAQNISFSIPAGPLAPALDLWASQSGRQLIYPAAEIREIRTGGAQGSMAAQVALRKLLENTGFSFREDRSGAIGIFRNSQSSMEGAETSPGPVDAASIVVVTGTRLRNIEAVASPSRTYTRADIERAGRADLSDFLQTLPQNFSGGSFGLTPDGLSGAGAQSFLNPQGAVSPNLRGLGPGSTLTLVNGHRVAPSAGSAFVDVGIIPQSMIERIDIVADGASAVYGSDAVGGVVNIILRDKLDGAESQVSYETDDGGAYHNFDATQSLGTDWQSGSALVSARFRKRGALDTADRPFSRQVGGVDRTDLKLVPELYPAAKEYALFAIGRQRLGSAVKAELDGWISRRDQDQVAGGYFVSAFATRSDQQALNGAIAADLPLGLNGNFSAGYSRSNDRVSQINATQAGGQDFFIHGRQDFDLWYGGGNIGGKLVDLPAGSLAFSMGGEHRDEHFLFDFSGDATVRRSTSRRINSAYGELLLPIAGRDQHLPLITRASLALAGRYDHYSDFGGAWTGRAGLSVDLSGLRVRGTYSSAFRAPNLNDLAQAGQLTVLGDPYTYYSPDRPGDFARVINILGFATLKPERARIATIGADASPRAIPGLTMSATYFNYDYRNRLSTPPFSADILLQPDVYGGVFRPVSSGSEVQQIFDDAEAHGGSVILFDPTIPLSDYEYVIDLSFRNIAAQRVRGFDFDGAYSATIGPAEWTARGAATVVLGDKRKISTDSDATDAAGLFGEQPRLKLRGELSARIGQLTATAALNHVSHFKNTNLLDTPRIRPFTTLDLNLQYELGRVLAGGDSEIGLTVRNLLDEDPPFVDRGPDSPSYDPANANPLGRVFLLRMKRIW